MRHKRKYQGSGIGGVNLGIIVTPMLDMSFQLLSFFIMVYSPNASEEFIGGELGKTKAAVTAEESKVKSEKKTEDLPTIPVSDPPPELEQTYTVLITAIDPGAKGGAVKDVISKDGVEPRYIQIKSPANELDKKSTDTGKNVIDLANFITSADEKEKIKERARAFKHIEVVLKEQYKEASMRDKAPTKEEGKKSEPGAIKTKIRIEADRGIQFDYVVQVFAACKRAGFDEVTFTTPAD